MLDLTLSRVYNIGTNKREVYPMEAVYRIWIEVHKQIDGACENVDGDCVEVEFETLEEAIEFQQELLRVAEVEL